jgi:poly-beta-1,6-N-acetyl-D-glucosamine N-deacetylase
MRNIRFLRNILADSICKAFIRNGDLRKAVEAISPGSILPLFFHRPRKDMFEKLIAFFINEDFTFISSGQLFDILYGKMELHSRAVWLSFDDGLLEILQNVIPALVYHNVPATFFLTTSPIEGDGVFWFTFAKANRKYLPKQYRYNTALLWDLTESRRRDILQNIKKGHYVSLKREVMTLADVNKIFRMPQVTIGCHSAHHLPLNKLSQAEQEQEISIAKQKLELWLGHEMRYFSYPKGMFDERTVGILRHLGFELAATTEERLICPGKNNELDPLILPRYYVIDDGYFSEAVCHALGIWQPFIRKVKQKLGTNPKK